MKSISIFFFSFLTLLPSCQKKEKEFFTIESEGIKLKVETIAEGIDVPFGMAFLSNKQMIVSNRPSGQLIIIDIDSGDKQQIENVPEVVGQGDGGMLDVILHPDFKKNNWFYFSYATRKDSFSTMVVDRAKLQDSKLNGRERLFTALPYYKDPAHFGSRLALYNGYLFITMGERYDLKDSAQTLSNHLGKVMRIQEDGKIPPDNPFVNTLGALPEIWSYGHRNPQGLIIHPVTRELWEHEHGPKGGDEINIIKPRINYGWPVITWGIDYDDKLIGEGLTEKEGMEQPIYYYKPSIAPSGMEFYTSNVIPNWKGNLFIGAMALRHLNRLVIQDNKVVKEERLLTDKKWRVRSVKQGPDGFLYIGTDGGQILRIRPL